MGKMMVSLYNIRLLDEFADKKAMIHNIHLFAKLIVTIAFLVGTVLFGKYEISRLLPLVFYPVVMVLADIPIAPILKRTIIAAPFAIGLGIFNPFFDVKPMGSLPWVQISGGWIVYFIDVRYLNITMIIGYLITGVVR